MLASNAPLSSAAIAHCATAVPRSWPATMSKRLALLYEQRGDRVLAVASFRRLAELWRGADPAFKLRAEAARRRAAALDPPPLARAPTTRR